MILRRMEPRDLPEVVLILKRELANESLLIRLGDDFLLEYYYPAMLQRETYNGTVAEFEGKVTGFIAWTPDSLNLFRCVIKKNVFKPGWVILKSLLKRPSQARHVFDALLFLFTQKEEVQADVKAEILTFGVLEEYRSLDFFKRTGIKTGNLLFAHAMMELADHGITRAKNFATLGRLSNIFFRNFGMEPKERFKRMGTEVTAYVINLETEKSKKIVGKHREWLNSNLSKDTA